MTGKISELQAAIGKAFLEVLFEQPDVDMRALHALFGHSDVSFYHKLEDVGGPLELVAKTLVRADLSDEQLIEVSREDVAKCLASLMGAKKVDVTW